MVDAIGAAKPPASFLCLMRPHGTLYQLRAKLKHPRKSPFSRSCGCWFPNQQQQQLVTASPPRSERIFLCVAICSNLTLSVLRQGEIFLSSSTNKLYSAAVILTAAGARQPYLQGRRAASRHSVVYFVCNIQTTQTRPRTWALPRRSRC